MLKFTLVPQAYRFWFVLIIMLFVMACSVPTAIAPTPTVHNTPVVATPAPDLLPVMLPLIRVEDHGAAGPVVGCDDSLVMLDTGQMASGSLEELLRQAYQALLSADPAVYQAHGLYNAVAQSQLAVDQVQVNGAMAEIRLVGQFSLGGECDTPRFEAQLIQTARQVPGIEGVQVYLNGQKMEDALSLK